MNNQGIYIGKHEGRNFLIPVFHSFLSGITQLGKTTALKRMIHEAQQQGYTMIVIDVKKKPQEKADFEDMGNYMPTFVRESARMGVDPLGLKGLLESASKLRLNFQFPELIKVCEGSKSLRDVLSKIDLTLDRARIHPIQRDKLEVLKFLLQGLVEELSHVEPSREMNFVPGEINVMNVSGFSDGFKQMVVKSVAEEVREKYTGVIVVFDEAHIQLPQQYSSASKHACTKLIKEGAGSRQFVWLADQTVTEVDKDVLKQCEVWLLGRQRELNEAKRALNQLPFKQGISMQDIMRLKVGDFFVATSEYVKKVHVEPVSSGVPTGFVPPYPESPWKVTSESVARENLLREKNAAIQQHLNTEDEEVPLELVKRLSAIEQRIGEFYDER